MQKAYVLFFIQFNDNIIKLIQQWLFPISEKETNLQKLWKHKLKF